MPSTTFFNLPIEKRNIIIDAAMTLFIENDYDKVTIRMIASHSNISIGSFYQYFEDKDDIYLFLITRGAKKVFDKYRDAYGTIFMKNKNLPLSNLLTKKELALDSTWYRAPVNVMIKFYFGEFSRNLSAYIMDDLLELKASGKLKDNVDVEFIFYQYVTSMFNLQMYFRENNIVDEERRVSIKNTYLNDLFINGILEPE